jgi:hypothetical protein
MLPLFQGGQSNLSPNEVNAHPMQIPNQSIDQPISDVDIENLFNEESRRVDNYTTMADCERL